MAASLLNSGIYKRILLVSAENPSPAMFSPTDMHSLPLFGAMACAVVLTMPPKDSDAHISQFYMETFGDQVETTTVRGEFMCFSWYFVD